MAKNQNKCIFTGRLGRDPESRNMPSGDAIVTFSLAVSDDFKDKTTGQNVEKTEWINCKASGKLGEICAKYLKKGSKVFIEAKFESRKYKDNQGAEKTVYEFLVRDMEMLDSKPAGASDGYGQAAGPRSRPGPSTSSHQGPPETAWPDEGAVY